LSRLGQEGKDEFRMQKAEFGAASEMITSIWGLPYKDDKGGLGEHPA